MLTRSLSSRLSPLTWCRLAGAYLALPAAGILTTSQAADLSDSYTWKPLKIGAGGWVVGMDIHPGEPGLMYVRTDVSGAYRWDPEAWQWRQVVTDQSMPADYVAYGTYRGVDSLVGAPDDPDVAYMAYRGEIFRSTDRGERWTATDFARHSVTMEPNGEGRQEGERLAIDPHNNAVVYFGSIEDGLWRTTDAGARWDRVGDIPVGTTPHGVNTIVFDPDSGTLENNNGLTATRTLYVTTDGGGIFQSNDAGETWTDFAPGGPGSAARVREAVIGPDGTYYVACDSAGGATGSIWKRSPADGWTDITPGGEAGGNQAYWGLAVDPLDDQHLFALRQGGLAFVSEDQGKSWTSHGFTLHSDDIRWIGQQENYWLSVGECGFDPAGRLWFAEGFGVWFADNLKEGNIAWQAASNGIEETCGNDIIASPGGSPVAAMWDIGVFHAAEPDATNAERCFPYFMAAWALDWCPADPQFIVGVFHNNLNFPPHIEESGYSTDGGRTWTRFPAVEQQTLPAGLAYGVIAVSAQSPDHLVWAPAGDQLPHYTADRGATWTRSDFGDVKTNASLNHWSPLKPLCADRVQADTFYFYHREKGVYRSGDGGATFTHVGNPVSGRVNSVLKSAPGHAGHVWFAEGHQGHPPVGGLWRSCDGGETWTPLPGIEQAFNFGFGKPLHPGGYPTLYVAGVSRGETGLWRSTDEGLSWDRIGGYPLGVFDWIDAMDGDKDVFGKVYLAFSGSGFAYGEPTPPQP
jgi:photosystem II stability/assembly factor-like uncharacterized protein